MTLEVSMESVELRKFVEKEAVSKIGRFRSSFVMPISVESTIVMVCSCLTKSILVTALFRGHRGGFIDKKIKKYTNNVSFTMYL